MPRQFLHTSALPQVKTKYGKIRGFQLDDVYTFLGVKYAEAERFQPPRPVAPWDGIRDALAFGASCPMMMHTPPKDELLLPHRWWPEDESCHYLNIWTPSLDKNAAKPVMVWLHGGQFNAGSAVELAIYDGDSMARKHDVVFVNLNHRLNLLGYFDMSSFDSKYENSVNAGIADIVTALEWIRDNIESFGGDPGNVTIFGQSGGGRKVTALMQAPAAEGLFHKAIIQSGTTPWNPESSAHHRPLANMMLEELGFSQSEHEKLAKAPYPVLVRAYAKARIKLEEREGILHDWTPVKNSWFTGAPPHYAFAAHARKVPLIVGSVLCERPTVPPMSGREKDALPPEERLAMLTQRYGEYTGELLRLFKQGYPDKNELTLLEIDSGYRMNMLNYIERKVRENDAGVPSYVYMFALEFDFKDGKNASHASDLAFAFGNASRVPACNFKGMERLEAEISGAWASFARTGDPNHPGLGINWPKYDLTDRPVLVFDRSSKVRFDHERELITLHHHYNMSLSPVRNPGNYTPLPDAETWVY